MKELTPYLTFNNTCREAMTFYKECLGGELSLMVVSDSPVKDQMPPQYHNLILHSELKTENFRLLASDMAPEALSIGNDVHLCINFTNEADMRKIFDKLSAGGQVKQPLNKMFFGWIGSLQDKFSKRWMVVCE